MSYRDVSESLRGYRDRIANDLEEARRAAREAAEHASRVEVLERELAETEGLLAKMAGKKRGLPLLDDIRIAAPCKASWDDMVGDEHVRFCGQCEKNVYNLSSLSRDEAEALLAAREGKMCVRLYRRADGTVLTEDCPVGARARRRRRAALAAVGAGLMATAAALSVSTTGKLPATTMGEPPVTVTAGAVALPTPSADPTTPPATTSTVQGQWAAGGIGRAVTKQNPVPVKPPPAMMGKVQQHQ
jgi:hypothetical protein